LPEAYIKTDYSKLTDKDFEKTLKKYALYKYMEENGLLEG
jgi:type I restriction enzyme M protein